MVEFSGREWRVAIHGGRTSANALRLCALLRLHKNPGALDGGADYPLKFVRPMCAADPPPDLTAGPAAGLWRSEGRMTAVLAA